MAYNIFFYVLVVILRWCNLNISFAHDGDINSQIPNFWSMMNLMEKEDVEQLSAPVPWHIGVLQMVHRCAVGI